MRITDTLLTIRTRRPQRVDKVAFQQILPMSLRNRVSGKGVKSSNVCCLQEMAFLFSCLKTNDFEESHCAKEVTNFQKCYDDHIAARDAKGDKEQKGIIIPGAKTMGYMQINQMLRKFPAPKPKTEK